MDDFDEFDLGDEDFHYSAEFDISDIRIDRIPDSTRKRLHLVMKADLPLNMMRCYLALKAYVHKIEIEMKISDEDGSDH